jgi:hypothetical protein
MTRKSHQPGARLGAPRSGIIPSLSQMQKQTMEAERINAIGNKIADLAQRGAELRRYL